MDTLLADCHRLTLLIQRILDADALCDTQGAALLTATEAACRFQEAGDAETARRYVKQVACLTEALVCTDTLALADGCAVLEMAHRILAEGTD